MSNPDYSKLYNMKLHETICIREALYVTRVPGGWIYTSLQVRHTPTAHYGELQINKGSTIGIQSSSTPEVIESSLFVPFDNEFDPGRIAREQKIKAQIHQLEAQTKKMLEEKKKIFTEE